MVSFCSEVASLISKTDILNAMHLMKLERMPSDEWACRLASCLNEVLARKEDEAPRPGGSLRVSLDRSWVQEELAADRETPQDMRIELARKLSDFVGVRRQKKGEQGS